MSTLTGLIGGGGGQPVPTSIPGSITAWTANHSVATSINSGGTGTLVDVVNITSGSGYLNQLFGYSPSSNNVRIVIIIDGTTILDDTAVSVSNDWLPFYPQAGLQFPSTGTQTGYSQTAIPLRFESSLRVRVGTNLGVTLNAYLNYLLT